MYEEIKAKLKRTLSKRRYIHSLGVADEAKRLAVLYGADKDKFLKKEEQKYTVTLFYLGTI